MPSKIDRFNDALFGFLFLAAMSGMDLMITHAVLDAGGSEMNWFVAPIVREPWFAAAKTLGPGLVGAGMLHVGTSLMRRAFALGALVYTVTVFWNLGVLAWQV